MHEMNFRGHWKTIRLEEIADVRAGSAFPIKYQGNIEGKYPFYKVSDMNLTGNETLMHASNNWVEEDTVKTLKAKLFPKDTVIFPKVGAAVHTNKKRMLSIKSLVDNNVMGVTIRDHDLCIPYRTYAISKEGLRPARHWRGLKPRQQRELRKSCIYQRKLHAFTLQHVGTLERLDYEGKRTHKTD